MSEIKKIGLGILLMACTVGCVDDYPLISRDLLAFESEQIDGLMKVVDEESAKTCLKHREDLMKYKGDTVLKRLEKWRGDLDKKQTKDFAEYVTRRDKAVAEESPPSYDQFSDLRMSGVYFRVTRENWAMRKALRRERDRIAHVIATLAKSGGGKFDAGQECPSLVKVHQEIMKSLNNGKDVGGGGVPGGPPGGPPPAAAGGKGGEAPRGAAGLVLPGM